MGVVERLLACNRILIGIRDHGGWQAVHFACAEGYSEMLNLLLVKDKGEPTVLAKVVTNDGLTPLHLACEGLRREHQLSEALKINSKVDKTGRGFHKCVEMLIKKGSDINATNTNGCTPLHFACWYSGDSDIAETLIRAGADVNDVTGTRATPLILACGEKFTSVVFALISHDALLDVQQANGASALYIASFKGHLLCARQLLSAGANPDLRHDDGTNAVIIASQLGHLACVELLIKAGACLDVQCPDGGTAVYRASQEGHGQCVKVLAKAGANLNIPSETGSTPLCIASNRGHVSSALSLIQAGAELDVQTTEGSTALYVASQNGHSAIVDALLKAGADPNLPKLGGWIPLHAACGNRMTACVKSLVSATRLDTRNNWGDAPIHLACEEGLTQCLDMMLIAGADANIVDDYNQQPIDIAVTSGQTGCVSRLLATQIELSGHDVQSLIDLAMGNGDADIAERLRVYNQTINGPHTCCTTICEQLDIATRFMSALNLPGKYIYF